MSQPDSPPPAPDHLDETVQRLAELHEQRARATGSIQRIANRVTSMLGRPVAVVTIVGIIALWIIGNAIASAIGHRAVDHFPFPDLGLFATVCAFLITLLILTTQRHEQEVSRRRDQLTLHMAVLTEKKIAKVIALLEEQRRDNPLLHERDDTEAQKLAEPTDPGASLDRIEASSLD